MNYDPEKIDNLEGRAQDAAALNNSILSEPLNLVAFDDRDTAAKVAVANEGRLIGVSEAQYLLTASPAAVLELTAICRRLRYLTQKNANALQQMAQAVQASNATIKDYERVKAKLDVNDLEGAQRIAFGIEKVTDPGPEPKDEPELLLDDAGDGD